MKLQDKIRVYVMSGITAMVIKLLNKYLHPFYESQLQESIKGSNTKEIIDYIQTKIEEGSEVYIVISKDLADNSIAIYFDAEEEDVKAHLSTEMEKDDEKLH